MRQLGVPPLRIDILSRISGVAFAEATAEAGHLDVDGRTILVIGREALIRNKRAAGRPQDLADAVVLARTSGDGGP